MSPVNGGRIYIQYFRVSLLYKNTTPKTKIMSKWSIKLEGQLSSIGFYLIYFGVKDMNTVNIPQHVIFHVNIFIDTNL